MSNPRQTDPVSQALDLFVDRIASTRRRTFPLVALEASVRDSLGSVRFLEAGEYRALARAVGDAVARGVLTPVRARGTNGRSPPLFHQYRVRTPSVGSAVVFDAFALHPRVDRAGARRLAPAHGAKLEALSRYLYAHRHPEARLAVPRNERSLELFGDEKFLENHPNLLPALGLGLADVHAFETWEPFFHRRTEGSEARALIVENLSAFESVARALARRNPWPWGDRPGLLVYGEGKKILRSVFFLAEFPMIEACDYFGDLDPAGLEILSDLRDREPRVRPAVPLYRGLLGQEALARPMTAPSVEFRERLNRALLGAEGLAEPTWNLFRRSLWLPQEALGLERLLAGP